MTPIDKVRESLRKDGPSYAVKTWLAEYYCMGFSEFFGTDFNFRNYASRMDKENLKELIQPGELVVQLMRSSYYDLDTSKSYIDIQTDIERFNTIIYRYMTYCVTFKRKHLFFKKLIVHVVEEMFARYCRVVDKWFIPRSKYLGSNTLRHSTKLIEQLDQLKIKTPSMKKYMKFMLVSKLSTP